MSHYDGTAEEIWQACDGKLDYMFLGAGTGGTVCGISRKLKEKDPNIKIIGVDPYGSILAEPAKLNEKMPPGGGYEVEGIGYDFVPRVLDRSLVDEWVKVGDEDALPYARRLVKEEGLLCGASSGTAMAAAMQYIKEHDIGEGKRCVVLFPDNIRNYITKFINDDWMNKLGLLTEEACLDAQTPKLVPNTVWGQEHTIASLKLKEAQFMALGMPCTEAISLIKTTNCDQFPVKNDAGEIVGVITATLLQSKLGR
jgi:cystathionine beta-synthase